MLPYIIMDLPILDIKILISSLELSFMEEREWSKENLGITLS